MSAVLKMNDSSNSEAEPTQATVDRVKEEYPDRDVAVITMADSYGEYPFVMVSPIREEWKKYRQEASAAGSDLDKIEAAIEKAALSSIKWPPRDSVKRLFDRKPGMVQNFADELAKLAGAHVEATAKKS